MTNTNRSAASAERMPPSSYKCAVGIEHAAGQCLTLAWQQAQVTMHMQAIEDGLGDADFSAVKETLKPKA